MSRPLDGPAAVQKRVGRVWPASPAARAGLQAGDVIVAVEGRTVERAGWLEGDVAFDETTGLRRVGVIEGGGPARDIVMHDDRAYVADARFGMKLYDLSDPNHPRMLGGNSALDAQGLVVAGDQLWVASAKDGLGMFSLATGPRLELEARRGATSGTIELRVNGPAGTRVVVERSPDLRAWTEGPAVTLEAVPVTLSIPITAGSEYFRLKQP